MAKLVVCVPSRRGFSRERLLTVAMAAKRIADQLGIGFDGAYRRSDLFDVSVYFQGDDGSEEWVYSDWEPNRSEETVYSLMFSLTDVLRQLARLQRSRRVENGIAFSG